MPKINVNMNKNMRELVKEGYEKSHYDASTFRKDGKLAKIEHHFLSKLVRLLPEGEKVLDLGCGPAAPIDAYLVNKGFDVTGVDFCQRLLALARKDVPQGEFVEGDFCKVEFDEESFDAAISLYAIFHIPRKEHEDLFLRMRRFLKPHGLILVTLGTSGNEYGEEKDWCGAPTMVWSTYVPDRYREIITNVGFTILESGFEGEPTDDEYHFWLLAQKR